MSTKSYAKVALNIEHNLHQCHPLKAELVFALAPTWKMFLKQKAAWMKGHHDSSPMMSTQLYSRAALNVEHN